MSKIGRKYERKKITFSVLKKSKSLKFFFFSKQKKSSLFFNIRNTRFDQSSPVQPNPKKTIWIFFKEISKNHFFFKERKNLEICFWRRKNAILLVLAIKEISLQSELSSPACCRVRGAWRSIRSSSSRTVFPLSNIGCIQIVCLHRDIIYVWSIVWCLPTCFWLIFRKPSIPLLVIRSTFLEKHPSRLLYTRKQVFWNIM